MFIYIIGLFRQMASYAFGSLKLLFLGLVIVLIGMSNGQAAVDLESFYGQSKIIKHENTPIHLPSHKNFEKAFKPFMQLRTQDFKRQHAQGPSQQSVILSRNASPGDRKILTGVMALIFAAMSTLTVSLWRHLHKVYAYPQTQRKRRR